MTLTEACVTGNTTKRGSFAAPPNIERRWKVTESELLLEMAIRVYKEMLPLHGKYEAEKVSDKFLLRAALKEKEELKQCQNMAKN
jgi:hypothetical protein